MCWLCGFKSQMLSVSTFLCLFVNTFVFVCFVLAALHQHCYVCEHLAVRVYHLLRRTQVLRRVTSLRERVFGESSIPRRDGRNESSRDTFPCHYNPSKPNSTDQFVTIRFNIVHLICVLYFSSYILYCVSSTPDSTPRWTFY